MNAERRRLVQQLEDLRGSRLLVYVTGDRRGLETQVHAEAFDFFTHHLDAIGDIDKISVFLYTRGGETLAAWSIANLVSQFCRNLEMIVPSKAHSAGTLMCLGADSIVMTKQATLGPIDPSVNTPLNPTIPGAPPNLRAPVSVEDINGFIEFARSLVDTTGNLAEVLRLLASSVHPLVLGNAYRARAQIRMLARKLMASRYEDEERVERILEFLCSESGSHDYTINRREAIEELKLLVAKPDDNFYSLIKGLYDNIANELELTTPFDAGIVLGQEPSRQYCFRRAIIQSLPGGTHAFVSEGILTRQQLQTSEGIQTRIHDHRVFEGWRHSND